MFKLHKKGRFLDIFQSTPGLEELVIDTDGMSDAKHVMAFSIQDMEALHLSLPNLKRLDLVDSVRLIESNSDNDSEKHIIARPSKLEKLHLSILIEKYAIPQWLHYFSCKYPQLIELTLSLSSPYQIPRQQIAPENQEKLALASFINSLALLKSHAQSEPASGCLVKIEAVSGSTSGPFGLVPTAKIKINDRYPVV
ncbi:hypothetical protein BD408DRAFT_399337 [Parasitella parasitica]|nr:hypothetical protein BD408DRAFT_399337 [Parasitella parasitica]